MSAAALALKALNTPPSDPDAEPRRMVMWMVGLVLAFLAAMALWAGFAQLDVAVQARGAVVPPSRLQEVGSLEGGIVKDMLVAPGDRVKKGQVVARLDSAQVIAEVGESRQAQLGALAGLARVEALLTGQPPQFDESWRKEAPALIDKEAQLWRDAQRELQANQAVGREAVARRRGELVETEAHIQALNTTIKLAEESFGIEERLFKAGAGARADYLGAQQKLAAARNERENLVQSLPRMRAGLAEARAQLNEAEAKMRGVWSQQRTEFQTKVATLGATLGGRQDKAERRELVSPMDGIVNRVLVHTVGGVVSAGRPLLEVVPDEARLQLTVRVKPSDIGFIHPGQRANVKVLPYDAATHGAMTAVVERVGADAVIDEKIDRGEPFFEVQLTAERDQIKLHGKPLPITAGMPVDVGILTGQRSVLQYLMKPVLRGIQGSLQER